MKWNIYASCQKIAQLVRDALDRSSHLCERVSLSAPSVFMISEYLSSFAQAKEALLAYRALLISPKRRLFFMEEHQGDPDFALLGWINLSMLNVLNVLDELKDVLLAR